MINLKDKQRFRYIYSLNSAEKVQKKHYPFVHVAPEYEVVPPPPYEPVFDWAPWLLAWYRSDYVELNGSHVSMVFDKTSNGRDMGIKMDTNYKLGPTYTASDPVFNGNPSIDFYAVNSVMTASVWELGQDGVGYTYFFVYSPKDWLYSGGQTVYDFTNDKTINRTHSALYREGQLALSLQGQAIYAWPGSYPFGIVYWPPNNSTQCFTVADNTGSWRRTSVWVTGTLVLNDYSNISGTRPQYLSIGGDFTLYFGDPVYPFSGSFAEIIIFSGTLPKQGITAIHKYIGSRYNIASMM